jgi:dolichol-phosphate mannosyltransferase
MKHIWVVVPTYNEKENIESIVSSIVSIGLESVNILFVDDSSPDGTSEKVRSIMQRESRVHLLVRPKKLGIGSAYKEGFRYALSKGCDFVVTMDADMQHPPEKIPELVAETEKGDIAIGSRYVRGGGIVGWSWQRRAISKIANLCSRLLLGLEVKDCTSGFRVYNKRVSELIANSDINASSYEFQVITLKYLKDKAKFVEVPYVFTERKKGESKLKVRDVIVFFLRVLWEAL